MDESCIQTATRGDVPGTFFVAHTACYRRLHDDDDDDRDETNSKCTSFTSSTTETQNAYLSYVVPGQSPELHLDDDLCTDSLPAMIQPRPIAR